ncbi:hypothetical protein E8E13_002463 [Curvularia kusanoi]|uniref:Uncharacterized protein n=1 Tax=Curvularia kusanoi TaxID=90978 RepID=A0A9P4WD46_CURKU|nr:hypothetical protein E8E13_002463 [Curvularia kusanoi]
MDEAVFAAMRSGEPDLPDEAWTPGLWAHMVKLVDIYAKIQELHMHLVHTDQWDEQAVDESVGRLEAELTSFDASLGPELSFSEENLARFVHRDQGSAFVAFHLGYHHYYTLVFYQYLDQRRPLTKNSKRYWPSVELMINRLVVFQRNCISSMGKNTHRFDKWMVKFLTAHALAMEEKTDFDNTDHGPRVNISGYAQLERGRITNSLMDSIQSGSDVTPEVRTIY